MGVVKAMAISNQGNGARSAAARSKPISTNTTADGSTTKVITIRGNCKNGNRSLAAAELMARALAVTAINGDSSPYEEAMPSPQREQWKEKTQEECNSILRSDAFTAIGAAAFMPTSNSEKRPFGSKQLPSFVIRWLHLIVILGRLLSEASGSHTNRP